MDETRLSASGFKEPPETCKDEELGLDPPEALVIMCYESEVRHTSCALGDGLEGRGGGALGKEGGGVGSNGSRELTKDPVDEGPGEPVEGVRKGNEFSSKKTCREIYMRPDVGFQTAVPRVTTILTNKYTRKRARL